MGIEVTGTFSGNLTSALNEKKIAANIIDGINADDIDALPALDLGEALQVIPGIQLNRAGGDQIRRESSVNLRGLPSSFTSVTANGQTIATTSRSTNPLGGPNGFGAFDGAVFNGVTVIKTSSADLPEGGIAGTINKKLGRALSSKERADIKILGRYEELTQTTDPGFVVKGVKHFADKTVGVSATVAYTDQTFRRDKIQYDAYHAIDDSNSRSATWDEETVGLSFEDWRAANNIPEDALVRMPTRIRLLNDYSKGDRISAAGSIEWKPDDSLRLGINMLYSKRDMDENGVDGQLLRTDNRRSLISPALVSDDGQGNQIFSEALNTGATTTDGAPLWVLPDLTIRKARIQYDSREWDIYGRSLNVKPSFAVNIE
jgi:iron complex outermembrane receptor protein